MICSKIVCFFLFHGDDTIYLIHLDIGEKDGSQLLTKGFKSGSGIGNTDFSLRLKNN